MRIVVMSGPAARGKTTIAHHLGEALGWPVISKDVIKTALASELPVADADGAKQLGRAAMATLLAVASAERGAVILDAVWRTGQGREGVTRLPWSVVEVFCRCDRAIVELRYAARNRPAGYVSEHADASELWSPETFEPVAAGWPVIEVDTAGEVDVVWLAAEVRRAFG